MNEIKSPTYFPGQKENEKIQFVIRKHWIVYVRLLLFVVLMFLPPFLVYLGLVLQVDLSANTKNILSLLLFLYLQFLLLITFIRWVEEDLDIMILTNERLISIDQVSFIHRKISETEIGNIQDVKHESKGILGNLFEFGAIEVQTAAEKLVFCIKDVPEPYETARRIMDLKKKPSDTKLL